MITNNSGPAASYGEFRYGGRVGTAFLDGFTFLNKPVQYVVLDGQAIIEGDISIGPVEEIERTFAALQAELRGQPLAGAVVITPGSQFAWPDCTIPYVINANLPNQSRVTDAIAHWESKTDFTFVRRTSSNDDRFPDYVEFMPAGGCFSSVGRQGGRQVVGLDDDCSSGNCIHEIGHAAGMWHHHSREDRDAFVTILWENITPGTESNFAQHITDGDDFGPYDYGSIMHYPRFAFSRNGQPTIVPADPDAIIGQRDGLSTRDIKVINTVLCTTVPAVVGDVAVVAVQKVEAVGLVPDVVGQQRPGARVWRQIPPAGRDVSRGIKVRMLLRPGLSPAE